MDVWMGGSEVKAILFLRDISTLGCIFFIRFGKFSVPKFQQILRVIFVNIFQGKVGLLYWRPVKLHLTLLCETLGHSESKERLGENCVLRHEGIYCPSSLVGLLILNI
jgi:hypothetical protein